MTAPADVLANAAVLRYLGGGASPGDVSIQPVSVDTDRWRLGANPDLVDWMWDELAAGLPVDARCLVAGGAAIAHPSSGLLLGVALGTQYALRLSGPSLDAALAAGYETRHEFRSVGRTLDLAATFGPGWVFGRFESQERGWLADSVVDAAAAVEEDLTL